MANFMAGVQLFGSKGKEKKIYYKRGNKKKKGII